MGEASGDSRGERATGPAGFEELWGEIAPVGRAASGGYFRQPYTAAEGELRAWFRAAARARGLDVEEDGLGNLVAWWRPVDRTPGPAGAEAGAGAGAAQRPGVLTGSHLDSVLDGGAYDGPLGVVSALAAIDRLRERGWQPARPLGVAVFAEEEGSRFGLPCLGSRLATGLLPWSRATDLADPAGNPLPDAMTAAEVAVEPDRVGWLTPARVAAYLELHVEQGRDLVHRDAPVGVATGIWPHGRWRYEFTGSADHAGTTRAVDRRDPMLAYAGAVLAARERAVQADAVGRRATFGRVLATPNATNAVPSAVTGWLDARAGDDETLATLVAEVEEQARSGAEREGTALRVVAESITPAVRFDESLRLRMSSLARRRLPSLATAAGHDAGVLQQAGIPSAMLFVRNPTGVSHSPDEHAETEDCLNGVEALADALALLAGSDDE